MAKNRWKCIAEHDFNDTIIITDPRYLNICFDEDDVKAKIGDRGLSSRTFYGDWGCTVYTCGKRVGYVSCEFGEKLGKFCADSGLVCVMTLKDALKFCPGILDWLSEREWCATIIEGFKGRVRFMTRDYDVHLEDGRILVDTELRVHGDGKVNGKKFSFESVRTSL